MYEPSLGRWHVVDPLAEDYHHFSPYNYGLNNPLFYIDPDGRGPVGDWFKKQWNSIKTGVAVAVAPVVQIFSPKEDKVEVVEEVEEEPTDNDASNPDDWTIISDKSGYVLEPVEIVKEDPNH
ncbi:MAG: hypothetical protein JW801_16125 [Bacteroidales bacterium]|nr:hypothetical protein [Bacteroidales bacterium]